MHLRVSAVQMSMSDDREHNLDAAEHLIRSAAGRGANLVVLPELFEGHYFCKDQLPEHLDRALPIEHHPTLERMRPLAAELELVLPISIYERANNALFNTVVMIDADGSILGRYRKSHVPDGPGYTEKYYFSPGDTGFRVWRTRYGTIGVGICWDQWFPEAARIMALLGAEVLCYPTAIGSEPPDPEWDSSAHWRRVMQGHAGANLMPVVAANRVGREVGGQHEITFYGTSFITDHTGAVVSEADRTTTEALFATFDLDAIRRQRLAWGLFRDRRPELYSALLSFDGEP